MIKLAKKEAYGLPILCGLKSARGRLCCRAEWSCSLLHVSKDRRYCIPNVASRRSFSKTMGGRSCTKWNDSQLSEYLGRARVR